MAVRVEEVVRTFRARARLEAERARARADALRSRLPIARAALARAGATEVWLFGSLAKGPVTATSDVDLATRGMGADRVLATLAELMEIFGAPVDLVRLEDAPESLRRRVAEEGTKL